MFRRRGAHAAFAAVVVGAGVAAAPATAGAAPVAWSCAASAVKATVAGGSQLNPITTGPDNAECREVTVGLPNVGEALSLDDLLKAETAYALSRNDRTPKPMAQTPSAASGIENLQIAPSGTPLIGVSAARSSIAGKCENGQPAYTTFSEVANISIGGTPLVLDGVLQPITDGLTEALGAVIDIKLNEVVDLVGGGKAVRAAHIVLVRGETPLADIIVAESQMGSLNGNVCDANAEGSRDETGGGNDNNRVCPPGSVFDVQRMVCVIPAPGSQTPENPLGDIRGENATTIGPPRDTATGGSVMTLDEARKKYKSPCLSGPGPNYVVVGTNGRDHITGGNRSERILGLGGKDRIEGGRGHDCVDGGKDRDVLTGGQGNDRVYGSAGNDSLNGDSGRDRLSGGKGNDTIVPAYGRDIVFGGPGRDRINAAVSGAVQSVNCGSGRDTVRAQSHDPVRNCERVKRVK